MYGVTTTFPAPVEMYDRMHAEMMRRAGPSVDGLLVHIGRATTDGFQIVEVWESKEQYDRAHADIEVPLSGNWLATSFHPRRSSQQKPSTYTALSYPTATS